MSENAHLRYEPLEPAPHPLAAAMGGQIALLIVTGIIVTPVVTARAAGLDAASTSWIVFAAMVAAGLSTWLQVTRLGIIGSGYVMFVGSNVAFVSVSVAAIKAGGLPLLATVAAIASLATFAFTRWLPILRRILTPAVGGVVLMLMAMSVAPVIWGMLKRVPAPLEGSPLVPMVAGLTLIVIMAVALFAKGLLRLWAPMLGALVGSAMAAFFGMVDTSRVAAAPWIGMPEASWPGLDLTFPAAFWGLLPAFVLITIVGGIETYADGIAVQRSSHRQPRPIDFKAVQGGINADGFGSFIAGLLGTVPNTVYSSSVAVTELTGVASRRVAWWGGLVLILLAFSPKVAAVIGAMPSPVVGAYILVLIVLLFGHGVRLVTEGGLGFEAGLIVCMGFWIGYGFQDGRLYNEQLPAWAQLFLSNGTTSGGLTAIALMALLSLRHRSVDALTVPLAITSVAAVRTLIQGFAKRLHWDDPAEDRLMLAAEEAMLFLIQSGLADGAAAGSTEITLRLRMVENEVELEFVTAPAGANVEGAIAALTDA
ncbi:MAG: solute carrier family 23 protein, partial [Alphaproteobacteria bacterium]